MCLTVPVRVVSVSGAVATVEVAGERRVVSAMAVPSVRPGDWAILAAGVLLRVLDPTTAADLAGAFHYATSSNGRPGPGETVPAQGGES